MSKLDYPRNMEPPEEVCLKIDLNHPKALEICASVFACKHLDVIDTQINILRVPGVIRLRGGVGGTDPNTDEKFNDIPYLTSSKFKWNGLPCFDFIEKVKNILDNGLGSINIKDGTLLMTVRMIDPGGINGNPMRIVATPQQIEESNMRNTKAFSCITNYIESNSELYKLFMRDFQTDGIAVYNVICAYGPIATPPRILRAREDSWTRMSMDSLRMNYTVESFIMWGEIVSAQARIVGKSGHQQKEKFISGLPSFFDAEKVAMQHSNLYLFPANYGMIPGFAGSPIAARAHPYAGQPDCKSMQRAYIADWVTKSANMSKGTPNGLVRSIEEAVMEDVVNLLSTDIKSTTDCFVCGGKGHAATQELPDGEKLICPTKVLRTGVSNGASNYTKPNTASSTTMRAERKAMANEIDELKTEVQDMAYKLHQSAAQKGRRRPIRRETPPPQLANECDDDDASASAATNDEDGSDDSAASHIEQFAEVVQRGKGQWKPRRSTGKQ